MSPEQVGEGQQDTGTHPAGQSPGADDLALDEREASDDALVPADDSSLVPDVGQEEISIADEVASQILQEAPQVFTQAVDELTEQQDTAMRMHRHYSDLAINGTEVSLGNDTPAQNAKDYLQIAVSASAQKVSLVRGMFSFLGKGGKKRGGGKDDDDGSKLSINGDNANVLVAFGSHREMLDRVNQINPGANGKVPANQVVNPIKKGP